MEGGALTSPQQAQQARAMRWCAAVAMTANDVQPCEHTRRAQPCAQHKLAAELVDMPHNPDMHPETGQGHRAKDDAGHILRTCACRKPVRAAVGGEAGAVLVCSRLGHQLHAAACAARCACKPWKPARHLMRSCTPPHSLASGQPDSTLGGDTACMLLFSQTAL